jgi:hypothetical protein
MDKNQRNTIEGWIEKANNQLAAARHHLSRFESSECVQAAQQCVELSLKAVAGFLGLDYPRTHGWNREDLARIVEQIQGRPLVDWLTERGLVVRLPRLLHLAKFLGGALHPGQVRNSGAVSSFGPGPFLSLSSLVLPSHSTHRVVLV